MRYPEEMTVRDALEFYSNIEGGDVDEVISLLNLESGQYEIL